jgi:serine protease DegQ
MLVFNRFTGYSMRLKIALILSLLLVVATGNTALPIQVDGQPLPSLAPVLERVTPSVVNVHTRTRVRVRSPLMDDPFFRRFFNIPDRPRERISQSLGSGVIVDSQRGYILTNNHVIEGADDISVTLKDGRTLKGSLIGTDPETDVAVIQIEADDLQALQLADSDQLRVGDFVVAVGNPFGLGQTVTSGIVSALGRTGLRGLEFQNFIQTDASINPGNSGGALINLNGELVGINTAIFTPSGGNVGIGFAIPSTMAGYVMQQLIRYGEVRRGSLGVQVQNLTADLAGAFNLETGNGVVIAEVYSGSPAARAGLEPGDVVTAIDGRQVRSEQDFRTKEGLFPIGQRLKVEFIRDGRISKADMMIEALQVLQGEDLDERLAGAAFERVPDGVSRRSGTRGVVITKLLRGSRLWREGLEEGDIITGINRQAVSDLRDFEQKLRDNQGRLMLQINRNGQAGLAVLD